MTYLSGYALERIEPIEGTYELRLPRFYEFFGFGSIVIGFFVFILMGIKFHFEDIMAGLFMLFIFEGLGLVCVLWYRNHKVIFNKFTVSSTNWLGKTTAIEWKRVYNISFNS